MKEQGTVFQEKEQDKYTEIDHNETEISDLPNREFKATVIEMLTKIRRACMNKVRISTKRRK